MKPQFENEEILNTALLVDMVYFDEKKLNHIRNLEKDIIEDKKNIVVKLAKEYGLESVEDLNSEYFIKDLVNYIWENIKEDVKNSKNYTSIKDVRGELYKKKKIKNANYFIDSDSETDIKREIVLYLLDQENIKLNSKFEPYGIEPYFKMGLTSVDLENVHNKKLLEIRQDERSLWENFKPLKFSKSIIEKYSKNYDVDTANNLKANFENGYVDIGIDGLEKDTSFMVGYLTKKDGEQVLQVVFRGTDSKIMSMGKYIFSRYPNMERQYHRLEPILNDILEEEQKNNPKLKIMFSGHSLGAAVAEKALSKHQDKHNIEYKGILIANPGSFHYLQSVMNTLDTWDNKISSFKMKNNKFTEVGSDAIKVAVLKPLIKVSSVTATTITILGGKMALNKMLGKEADSRSLTINHRSDIIHFIGSLLAQNKNNKTINLTKDHSEIGNNFIVDLFNFHKTFNYYLELKELAKNGNIFTPKMYMENKESIINKIRKMKDAVFGNKLQEVSFKPT